MLKLTMKAKEGQAKGEVKTIDIGDGTNFSLEKQGVRYYDRGLALVFMLTWDQIDKIELKMDVTTEMKKYAAAYQIVNSDRKPTEGIMPGTQAVAAQKLEAARAKVNSVT